jgi:TPR repeat protein
LALGGLKAQRAKSDEEWSEVAHWYRLAADAGHPSAMVSLAELYESGQGVAGDRAAALTLYRQALNAGHSAAAAQVRRIETLLRSPEYAR